MEVSIAEAIQIQTAIIGMLQTHKNFNFTLESPMHPLNLKASSISHSPHRPTASSDDGTFLSDHRYGATRART